MTYQALPDLRPGAEPFVVENEEHRERALKSLRDALGVAQLALDSSAADNPQDVKASMRRIEAEIKVAEQAPVRSV